MERGLATNTLSSYRRDLDRYVAFLGGQELADRDLADVAERDITNFLVSLRRGSADQVPLASSSAARAVSAVRGFHRFAVRDRLVATDAAASVRPPAPPRRLPKALSVSDVEALLGAVGPDDDPLAVRDRALLEFLYGTGARISEAVGCAIDDVSGDSVVLHGKGGKTRVVPVGGYATRALDAYLVRARPGLAARGRGTPKVFLNARGGPLSRQSAWTILQAAADRAGLAHVSPHTLRHSYATHLLDGGADIRVVQELLGHASVTTTQVYTLVTVEKLREVYAASHPRALG